MNTPVITLILGAATLISSTVAVMLKLNSVGPKVENDVRENRDRLGRAEGRIENLEKMLSMQLEYLKEKVNDLDRKLDEFFRPTGPFKGGE